MSTPTYDEYVTMGQAACITLDDIKWYFGDLINEVLAKARRYGNKTLIQFANDVGGISERSAQSYAQTSAFYGENERKFGKSITPDGTPVVFWTHYRIAMGLGTVEKAMKALELSAREGWGVKQFALHVKEIKTGKPTQFELLNEQATIYDVTSRTVTFWLPEHTDLEPLRNAVSGRQPVALRVLTTVNAETFENRANQGVFEGVMP